MIKALKEQYKTTKDDIQKLGVQIQKRNEILQESNGFVFLFPLSGTMGEVHSFFPDSKKK